MVNLMKHLDQWSEGASRAARPWRWPAADRKWAERFIRGMVALAAAIAALVLFTATASGQRVAPVGAMPFGWYATGDKAGDYAVGADPSRRNGGQGQHGGTIRALTEDPASFATLQQSVRATNYRGARLRLSAFVKSSSHAPLSSSALWMRVDGPAGSESIDFMQDRPIERGKDWARYDVVLDVPKNAAGISFGVLLYGRGQVWLDDVVLETVGTDVLVTGRAGHMVAAGTSHEQLREELLRRREQDDAYRTALYEPINLSFTDGTRLPRRR
jgi:hypothetical protein